MTWYQAPDGKITNSYREGCESLKLFNHNKIEISNPTGRECKKWAYPKLKHSFDKSGSVKQ